MSSNIKTYMSGTRVRTIANFTNISGTPTDPDTTELKYRAGAGSVQTISSPTHGTTGEFFFDIDTSGWLGPDMLLYTLQWKGTGAVQAIGPDYFQVEPPTL